MGFKLKALVVVSSGLVLGVCTYAAYRAWKKRQNSADDEGFEDVSKASINNTHPALCAITDFCRV